MSTITATKARSILYKLIDEAASLHKPVTIRGKRGNAVLLAEEDWNSVQETLYLMSLPGMRKSIANGLKTPLSKCKREIKW
jgi:PHD/YefM family antitoxin component YafN of YafNO toxin-antitoxin module